MTIMRPVLRRLAALGIAIGVFAPFAPSAGAATATVQGTISGSSSSRSSSVDITAPSVCGNSPAPQAVANGPYHFDAYTFDSSFGSQCVTVTVNSATGQGVLVTAYAIGTDVAASPASIIGTSGDCLPSPDGSSFAFTSPAAGFLLVVEECASGTGGTYSVTATTTTTAAVLRGVPGAVRTGAGVRVRWQTASEVGVVAYNVYRVVAGRRVRVNSRPIAAGRLTYTLVDRRAAPGARVQYWVQAVRTDGSRSWLGRTPWLRV